MMSRPRTLVIINPASARARRAWPVVRAKLKESGISFDEHETAHAGDATTRTRAALREGYQCIAVVGGDGTLSEVASGFFEFGADKETEDFTVASPVNSGATLALLPAGTGDDFARGLAGRREPLEHWLEIFIAHQGNVEGRARALDVIQARATAGERDFICLNVATIGLGAEVAARVAAQGAALKRLPGEVRFVSAALGALAAWRERRVRVFVDGGEAREFGSNLIAVANGTYAGGGMMFAPDARTDDGLIDLVLTRELTRATILRELPRIRQGGHLMNPRVSLIRASHIRIETEHADDHLLVEADGNVRGHTPAEFRILPAALRVIM